MKWAGSQGEYALIRDYSRWRGVVPHWVLLQVGWGAGNQAMKNCKFSGLSVIEQE